jgi:hypothetical protein
MSMEQPVVVAVQASQTPGAHLVPAVVALRAGIARLDAAYRHAALLAASGPVR